MNYEKDFLISKGLYDLSNKVRHMSKETNDRAGYDILSFTIKGEEKYIEVKTTEGGINTPFMIEDSEVNFSKKHADKYYLYRLFNYNMETQHAYLYEIKGNIAEKCILTSKTYIIHMKED